MKNSVLIAWAFCLLLGVGMAADTAGDYMTVSRYTELLIPMLGLESNLPSDYDKLTPEEACQARKNVLIAQGLSSFASANCPQCLTRCLLAEVTFELVRRSHNLAATSCEDKIRVLAENGFLGAGDPTQCMPAGEVLRLLQLPAFTSAVAAYFGVVRPLGTQTNDIVTDPFGNYRLKNVTEETASPVLPSRKK